MPQKGRLWNELKYSNNNLLHDQELKYYRKNERFGDVKKVAVSPSRPMVGWKTGFHLPLKLSLHRRKISTPRRVFDCLIKNRSINRLSPTRWMSGAGGGQSPNLSHKPFGFFNKTKWVRVQWLGDFHSMPLPDTTIDQLFQVEVSNSCTVTVTLVQIRTRSLQIGIIGDNSN